MPNVTEKACLGCKLPICDDKNAKCQFVQIRRLSDRTRYAQTTRKTKLKKDIVCILTTLNNENLTRREMVMAITKAQRAERVRQSRFKKKMAEIGI